MRPSVSLAVILYGLEFPIYATHKGLPDTQMSGFILRSIQYNLSQVNMVLSNNPC